MVICHGNWKLSYNSMHVAQPASSVRAVMHASDQDIAQTCAQIIVTS